MKETRTILFLGIDQIDSNRFHSLIGSSPTSDELKNLYNPDVDRNRTPTFVNCAANKYLWEATWHFVLLHSIGTV